MRKRGGEDRPPDAEPKKRRRQKDPADPSTKKAKHGRFRLAKDRRVEAVGIAVITFGCLVTALVWMGVRESNNVSYQLPIIASGGLVAVGCFIVGGLLLVGGLVMTRFARQQARAATPDEVVAAESPASALPASDGTDHEVSLSEGTVARRELAG